MHDAVQPIVRHQPHGSVTRASMTVLLFVAILAGLEEIR